MSEPQENPQGNAQGNRERDPFWTGAKYALGCMAAVVGGILFLIVLLVLLQFAVGFWQGLTGG